MNNIKLKCNRCSTTLLVDVKELFVGETVTILREDFLVTCSTCGKDHVGGEVIKRLPAVTETTSTLFRSKLETRPQL